MYRAIAAALITLATGLDSTPCLANEFLRPQSIKDFEKKELATLEKAVRVEGAEVAWANYPAIRRDFPEVASLSNEEIRKWLIKNFAYVGSNQSKLSGLRSTEMNINASDTVPAFRPLSWNRAALLEAKDSTGKAIGLVDVKGIGHGAQTPTAVQSMVRNFKNLKDIPGGWDKLRIQDHSDGMMSFGEAIAETTRQQAAQRLFELHGGGFETVESYAVIVLPFEILKDNNKKIPAALYLRQAHIGRESYLPVPPTLYADEHGQRQMTSLFSAVDFGGVVITDPRLESTYGKTSPFLPNPQASNPWAWGHDTATAWKRGDKEAVERHLKEMLSPIEQEYLNSQTVAAYQTLSKQRTQWAREFADLPWSERKAKFKQKTLTPIKELQKKLQSPDRVTQRMAASELPLRNEPELIPTIVQILESPQYDLLSESHLYAAHSLYTNYPDVYKLKLKELIPNPEKHAAAKLLIQLASSWEDPEAVSLLKNAALESTGNLSQEAVRALSLQRNRLSIEALKEISKSPRQETRELVARSLKMRSEPEAVELLKQLLNDPHTHVVTASFNSLSGRSDPESLRILLTQIWNRPEREAFALDALAGRAEPAAQSALSRALKSKNDQVRNAAIRSLNNPELPEQVSLLAPLFDEPSSTPYTLAAAIDSLRYRTDSLSLDLLSRATKSNDSMIRMHAYRVLATREDPAALALYRKAFTDPVGDIQKDAHQRAVEWSEKRGGCLRSAMNSLMNP